MEKKKKRELVETYSEYLFFRGSLKGIIDIFSKTHKDFTEKGYKNLEIEIRSSYCDDEGGSVYYAVYGEREETDKEFEARKRAAEKRRIAREIKNKDGKKLKMEEEKIEYERLKKIYG